MKLRDAIHRIALEWPAYGRPQWPHCRVAGARLEGQPQAGSPHHAGRQPALPPETEVRGDHRLQPRTQRLPEACGPKDDADGAGSISWVADITFSTSGCRRSSFFLGVTSRRLFAPRDRLGAGSNHGRRSDVGSVTDGIGPADHPAGDSRVHHSDRGSQYASNKYTDLLKEHNIDISMSRKGTPWDNAACESFMKTLKYEEVFRVIEYRDLAEAHRSIERFLEKGLQRKTTALGAGLPPACRV